MKKKRKTSVTLDKTVLDWIAVQIEKRRFRSVSHAVEYAIYKLMESERENTQKKAS